MQTLNNIFSEAALKLNPDFNVNQFIDNNGLLYDIIITSMRNAIEDRRIEINRLRKIVEDDTEYKALLKYAKELEMKLGINQESHK